MLNCPTLRIRRSDACALEPERRFLAERGKEKKEKESRNLNPGLTAWVMILKVLRISNKEQPFFLLDQLSITLICVPSYDLSYNVFLFPYWLVIGYFSVTTRI